MRAAPRGVPDLRSDKPVSLSCLSARLPSAQRLLRKNGFNHVVHAENVADRSFKVFFVRNRKANARLGIVVGKKTLPGAVSRNRIKRIIREVFRQHSIKMCGLDLVVMVKRAYSQADDAQVGRLNMLLSRVESLCAE